MHILRTPESRFAKLTDYPFVPHYTEIHTADGSPLRIHHLDEGPREGPIVLLLHGQPAWSYLYRKMIPLLSAAGVRCIAPDLPGFGRSDKPAAREDYSYEAQVDWMTAWLVQNDFSDITLFGQDWGGLVGLRMIVEQPKRFTRVMVSNTGLPYNPDVPPEVVARVRAFLDSAPTPTLKAMSQALRRVHEDKALAFAYWQKFCWETEDLPVGFMMSSMLESVPLYEQAMRVLFNRIGWLPLRSGTLLGRGYEAPFPDPSFKMGPRAMPSLVPMLPDDPALEAQQRAWAFYSEFHKPFLCAFTDDDPITRGGDQLFMQKIPGAQGQPHTTISGGGHFVQERRPQELVEILREFVRQP
jgi:haloalkane dehalogenase